MQQSNKIKQYTDSVCNQIRWKQAHPMVSGEIENHILDQKNAFIDEGLDEETAADKAIEEMGDPVIVGSQLDRTHRPRTAWGMITLTMLILLIGLAIDFWLQNDPLNSSGLPSLYRSVLAAAIGIVCMIIAYWVDFSIIGKYPKIIFIALAILMLLAFPLSAQINGARRWINIPILASFSTSIFMLLCPTIYAGVIYSMRNKGYAGILLCGVLYAIPAFIACNLKYGVTGILLYTIVCLILLTVSILNGWFNVRRLYGMLLVYVPTGLILRTIIFDLVIRSGRFVALLDPYVDPNGHGYVSIMIKELLSGAKLFGQGVLPMRYIGASNFWLPSFNTDYVITYIIYRAGWVAFIAVLSVLVAFIAYGLYLCAKQKNVLGRLVAMSVVLTFTMQTVIYLSANLGFPLFSQLTLPLVSYGGTSAIANLLLIGTMLSVFKSGYLLCDDKRPAGSKRSGNKMLSFVDGKIIIDLGLK